jgi:hypothetical protein
MPSPKGSSLLRSPYGDRARPAKKERGWPRRTESPGNLFTHDLSPKKKMLGKEEQWLDQYCWGRAIMPIKAPQTIEDEQPTANRIPCRLDRPRGSQTLARALAQSESGPIRHPRE